MDSTVSEFLAAQRKAFRSFRKELSAESDRGCALFAAAYLDKALSDLLYVSLVENRKIEQDLFKGNAPLSSFSSRIKLAYYLGKISAATRKDLDTIREVRNDFAHYAEAISFNRQSISDLCKNLAFSYHEQGARPRAKFTAAVAAILAQLHAATAKAVAPSEMPDDRLSDFHKKDIREKAKKAVAATLARTKKAKGEAADV